VKQSKAQRSRTLTLAGKLAEASLEKGVPTRERVGAVLKFVSSRPHREQLPLLSAYGRLMRRREFLRTLSIEKAGAIDASSRDALVAALSGAAKVPLLVGEKENPDLVAGLRVRLGDDVYDASLAGILARLGSAAR
jgi:F-type H+-transporting ATPase subunit delta